MSISTLVRRIDGKFRLYQLSEIKYFSIEEDSDTSNGLDIQGYTYASIEFPSSMTGTELKIDACTDFYSDNPSWKRVYDDDGNEISIDVTTNRIVVFAHISEKVKDSSNLIGPLHYIRFVSNATETGDRELKLLLSR